MEYKDYLINICQVTNGMYEASISRKDGRKIKIAVDSTEQDVVTDHPRPTQELAIEQARRMIDGGGMK